MKLYYSTGACSLAVRITINEIGIPCEFIAVNLKTKKTEQDIDYYTIAPKGAVPALQLDNKTLITENTAILQYLADTHHADTLLPPVGDLKRYQVLEWLSFVSAEIHKSFAPFFKPGATEQIKEDFLRPNLRNRLAIVEKQLTQNKYLTDHDYTLPDGYLFVTLTWLGSTKIELADYPAIKRYMDELKNRKAVRMSLEQEKLTEKIL